MKFRKVPQENEALLAEIMVDFPEFEKRQMFGCLVWFLKGNMVVGALNSKDEL